MRVLHVGDIHLREWENLDDTLQALGQVADLVSREKVDAVLIPGDLYDHKSTPHERALMAAWLMRLHPAAVYICKGNHDVAEDLVPLGLASHVHVYERPELVFIGGAQLLVLPWPERAHLAASGLAGEGGHQAGQAALGELVRTMAASIGPWPFPTVIMGHLSVVGSISSSGQPMVGREIQVVEDDLRDTGAEFIALNHIHKPQPLYAGSLTVQDFGEEGEEKRVVLFDTETGLAESIPIKGRRWFTINAGPNHGGLPPWEEVGHELPMPEVLDAMIPGSNVRYRYDCKEEDVHQFDHAAIEKRFADAHSLKIEPRVTRAARVRAADVAEAKTLADKLRAWGTATGTEITPSVLAKLEELEGGK